MNIKSEKTILSLSNAISLATEVVKEVAGHEVADTLEGNVVKRDALYGLIGSQIVRNFSTYISREVK